MSTAPLRTADFAGLPEGAAITGVGAVSAIGLDPATMLESLRSGRGGISRIEAFSTEGLTVHHASELRGWRATDHFPPEVAARMDRTAQLAVVAARQAVADAGLLPAMLHSERTALVFGICAGGIGASEGPGALNASSDASTLDREQRERLRDMALHAQTAAVAADLGITGPCLTVSTACATSTSALAAAYTLLQAGRVDTVVVGGADAWSRAIYAGFYSLGAMSTQPCSPFSRATGATFGEGSGCVVLERPELARERNARVQGVLLGCGTTSDAHHMTSPNPSGQGLLRAMQLALADARLPAEGVGYINVHGTGTPDNDIAETLAIRRLFEGGTPAPISSSKSFFGHTLGAAGILEFVTSLIGMNAGFLPPTINHEAPRVGCDLDCVPNEARLQQFDTFMSMSAAFGGINAAVVGARAGAPLPRLATPAPAATAGIVVTGIGIVSPVGHGVEAFEAALRDRVPGVAPITRFPVDGLPFNLAGLVGDLPARRLAPAADTRRMDAITRYATVATTLAMKDAGLAGRVAPEKVGIHMAMSAGPVGSAQAFAEELMRGGIDKLGAKYFPVIVMSTVGGQVSQACQIRGASFTFMEGVGASLQALAHAHDFMRLHPELDAMVLVAADEIASGYYRFMGSIGELPAGGAAPLFDPEGSGMAPGEGCVALILERAEKAAARGARTYGRIAGVALGSEGRADEAVDPTGATLTRVARQAIAEAGVQPDVVYGLARGMARHDEREAAALRGLLDGRSVPVSTLNGQLGVAEATCGLYAVAGALLGMRQDTAWAAMNTAGPVQGLDLVRDGHRSGSYRHALVLGSSRFGNSAAVMLSREVPA